MKIKEILTKIKNWLQYAYDYLTGKVFRDKPVDRIEYEEYISDLFDSEINSGINQIRKDLGLNELEVLSDVSAIAYSHCKYMSETQLVNHDYFTTRSEQVKLRHPNAIQVGENVAYNYTTAKSTIAAWKNSPGHYENIIKPEYKYTGIAHIKGSNNRIYAVQLFLS